MPAYDRYDRLDPNIVGKVKALMNDLLIIIHGTVSNEGDHQVTTRYAQDIVKAFQSALLESNDDLPQHQAHFVIPTKQLIVDVENMMTNVSRKFSATHYARNQKRVNFAKPFRLAVHEVTSKSNLLLPPSATNDPCRAQSFASEDAQVFGWKPLDIIDLQTKSNPSWKIAQPDFSSPPSHSSFSPSTNIFEAFPNSTLTLEAPTVQFPDHLHNAQSAAYDETCPEHPRSIGWEPSIAEELKALDNFLNTYGIIGIPTSQQEPLHVAFKTEAYATEVQAFDQFIQRCAVGSDTDDADGLDGLASSKITGLFPQTEA